MVESLDTAITVSEHVIPVNDRYFMYAYEARDDATKTLVDVTNELRDDFESRLSTLLSKNKGAANAVARALRAPKNTNDMRLVVDQLYPRVQYDTHMSKEEKYQAARQNRLRAQYMNWLVTDDQHFTNDYRNRLTEMANRLNANEQMSDSERLDLQHSFLDVANDVNDQSLSDYDQMQAKLAAAPYIKKAVDAYTSVNHQKIDFMRHPSVLSDIMRQYYNTASDDEKQAMDGLSVTVGQGAQAHELSVMPHGQLWVDEGLQWSRLHPAMYVQMIESKMDNYDAIRGLDDDLRLKERHSYHIQRAMSSDSVRHELSHLNVNYALQRNGFYNYRGLNLKQQYNPNSKDVVDVNETYYPFVQYDLRRAKAAHVDEQALKAMRDANRYGYVLPSGTGKNYLRQVNSPLSDSIATYFSRDNQIAFNNMIKSGQLAGMTQNDIDHLTSMVKHLQNNSLPYTLGLHTNRSGYHNLEANLGNDNVKVRLTGMNAGSVVTRENGDNIAYRVQSQEPLIVMTSNVNASACQDTMRYLMSHGVPFTVLPSQNMSDKEAKAYTQVMTQYAQTHDGADPQTLVAWGGFASRHAVLAVGYDPHKLEQATMPFQLVDYAAGVDVPNKLDFNNDLGQSGQTIKRQWHDHGTVCSIQPMTQIYLSQSRMSADDKANRNALLKLEQKSNDDYLMLNKDSAQRILNDKLAQVRENAFHNEIERVFYSTPENRSLLYTKDHLGRLVKDNDVNTVDSERVVHSIDQLSEQGLTEHQSSQIVTALSNIKKQEIEAGLDQNGINQALADVVRDNQLENQAIVNLSALYHTVSDYMNKRTGTSLEHFDPQYIKEAIVSDGSRFSYGVDLMKKAGITKNNLFTHGDEIQLGRTIEDLVTFDPQSQRTIEDLQQHRNHDIDADVTAHYEGYLHDRFKDVDLPIKTDYADDGVMDPDVRAAEREDAVKEYVNELRELDHEYQDIDDLGDIKELDEADQKRLQAYRELRNIEYQRAEDVDRNLANNLQFIKDTLTANGVRHANVLIDKNGIVQWNGELHKEVSQGSKQQVADLPLQGEIGQMFGVDQNGLMEQTYASGRHKFYVPGNTYFYGFDGDNQEERMRIKSAQDQLKINVRNTVRNQINHATGEVSRILGTRFRPTNLGYSIVRTEYAMQHPNATKAEIDAYLKTTQAKNDINAFKQATTDADGNLHYLSDPALMARAMNVISRTEDGVLHASTGSDVTALNHAYSKEMYGQSVSDTYKVARAYNNDAMYKDDQMSRDHYVKLLQDMSSKTILDKSVAKDVGAMSYAPWVAHSSFNTVNARLANRQVLGQSSVGVAAYFDDVNTGSGANQGRQQTLSKTVLDALHRRDFAKPVSQTYEVDDGNQYKIAKKDRNQDVRFDMTNQSPGRVGTDLSSEHYDNEDRAEMRKKNEDQSTNQADAMVVMSTMGGWTAEDSIVVSKAFAEQHKIKGLNDEYRDLRSGDKLSDAHGNKGVVSLVVDPNMSADEAKKQHMEDVVKFFHDNPEVEICFDPESPMSRANMGVIREAQKNGVTNTTYEHVDRAVRSTIFTDKVADKDAHVAGEHDKGRSEGSLFQNALVEGNFPAIAKQMIADRNDDFKNIGKLAEGLEVNITPHGGIISNDVLSKCVDDYRNIKVYDLDTEAQKALKQFNERKSELHDGDTLNGTYFSVTRDYHGNLSLKPDVSKMLIDMSNYDHIQVKLPRNVDAIAKGQRDANTDQHGRYTVNAYDIHDNGYNKQTSSLVIVPASERERRDLETGQTSGLTKMYGSVLRSGMQLALTGQALKDVYMDKMKADNLPSVQAARQAIMDLKDSPDRKLQNEYVRAQELVRQCNISRSSVNQLYRVAQSTIQDKLGGLDGSNGKQKAFREHAMKPSQPNSATVTAHCDPRLSIDEVMISKRDADKMNIHDGDTALLQRDPMQKVGNMRTMYVRVNNDPSYQGIGMQPIIVKSFDGDFDGDKYGLTKLNIDNDEIAKEVEALRPHNNLLDQCVDPDKAGVMLNISVEETAGMKNAIETYQKTGENILNGSEMFNPEEYLQMRQDQFGVDPSTPLTIADAENDPNVSDEQVQALQTSMDGKEETGKDGKKVKIAPFVVSTYVGMKVLERARQIDHLDQNQRGRQSDVFSKEIQRLESKNVGALSIECKSRESAYNSMKAMVDTGAKGSDKKLAYDFMYYDGLDNKTQGNQNLLDRSRYDEYGNFKNQRPVMEEKQTTQERYSRMQTQLAMRIKTDFTAVAGALEQRLLLSAGSVMPRECSEMAAGFYQDLLQAKHDPDDAVARLKRTMSFGSMLSGINPHTNHPYESLDALKSNMTDLVINQVHCKVSPNAVERLCNDMATDNGFSLESGFEDKVHPYQELMFGHGLQTWSKLVNQTENAVNVTNRQAHVGEFKTLVDPDALQNKTDAQKTYDKVINNLISKDVNQPTREALRHQAVQHVSHDNVEMREPERVKEHETTNEPEVHSHDHEL